MSNRKMGGWVLGYPNGSQEQEERNMRMSKEGLGTPKLKVRSRAEAVSSRVAHIHT